MQRTVRLAALAVAIFVGLPSAQAAGEVRAVFSPIQAGPGMDVSIVRRYLQRHRRRLSACYAKRAVKRANTGHVHLTFSIGPNGTVLVAAASGFQGVGACAATLVRRIRFPRPKGGKPMPVYIGLTYQRQNFGRGGVIVGTSGSKYGTGMGAPGWRWRRRVNKRLEFVWPQYRVVGGLHKDIVRRYLLRKRPRLRYCLDRALLVNPNLRGQLYARFTILPTSQVISPVVNGIRSGVSSCVAGALRSMVFPKPRGGSVVNVHFAMRIRDLSNQFPSGMSGAVVTPVLQIGGGYLDIHGVVLANAKRLHRCYKRQLRKNPKLRGRVTVRFGLRASGKPIKLVAWGMGAVAGCLAYLMRKLRFPSGGPSDARVTYRFTFAPK